MLIAGVWLLARCGSRVPPSATNEQARIVLLASPAKIQPRSGVSLITAIGTKASGAPIWENTPIIFSTDLGRVDPASAEFRDGKAYTHFYAPAEPGTATVSAVSGTVQIQAIEIDVAIPVDTIALSANRTSVPPEGGSVKLRATAVDSGGRPIASVPVVFTTTAGTLLSGGRPMETDLSGIAHDTLNTLEAASVAASCGSITSNTLEIVLEQDNEPPVADFVFSPASPAAGDVVRFDGGLSTDADGAIREWDWQLGDGTSYSGKRCSHAYTEAGTYNVVLCVTDDDGARGCKTSPVTVTGNVADDEHRAPVLEGYHVVPVTADEVRLGGSRSVRDVEAFDVRRF